MSNKTSDKNVANIERLNNFANMTFLYGHRVNLNVSGLKGVQQDIKNVLAELEQKDKRIKELEEENRIYVLEGSPVSLEIYIKENYIPKQVVKDKIKEIKRLRDKCITTEGYNIANGEVVVLQELLEGEK